MVTTRWTDSKTINLDESIALMLTDINDDATYVNWEAQKYFQNNQIVNIGNRTITYNLISLSYDQITPGIQPIEDRTKHNSFHIVPYYNGVRVNYIIEMNTKAQTILRKLLHYEGKMEIERNAFALVDNNFFLWIINKVYNDDFVIETGNDEFGDISIDVIKEFKGDTEDLLTKVTAKGESVINIISTLSFLLESNKLNQILLEISSNDHSSIELRLSDKGTISTSYLRYVGRYSEHTKEAWKAEIYLLIYLEIMPALIQEYQNDAWDKSKNICFMKKVAEDVTQKIEKKIEMLSE